MPQERELKVAKHLKEIEDILGGEYAMARKKSQLSEEDDNMRDDR